MKIVDRAKGYFRRIASAPPASKQATPGVAPSGATVEGRVKPSFALPQSYDTNDRVKEVFIGIINVCAPFFLAFLLGMSNGYLFAGFHEWSWGAATPITMAWLSGWVIEFIGLAAVFVASLAFKRGQRGAFFWSAMTLALAMSLISLAAQVAYLTHQQATLQVADSDVNALPVVSWFVGFSGAKGHEVFFFLRAIAYHVGEIGCAFVISSKEKTIAQALREHQLQVQAQIKAVQDQTMLDLQVTVADVLNESMKQVGVMVSTSMSQALLEMRQRYTVSEAPTHAKIADQSVQFQPRIVRATPLHSAPTEALTSGVDDMLDDINDGNTDELPITRPQTEEAANASLPLAASGNPLKPLPKKRA